MTVNLKVGPGAYAEDVVWTPPYNWGGGNRGIDVSIQGSGAYGINCVMVRSMELIHPNIAGLSLHFSCFGVDFAASPAVGGPVLDHCFKFTDKPNSAQTILKFNNSQFWCSTGCTYQLLVDAATPGAGALTVQAHETNFQAESTSNACGLTNIGRGRFAATDCGFYSRDIGNLILAGGANATLNECYIQATGSGNPNNVEHTGPGASGAISLRNCTVVGLGNGDMVQHLGSFAGTDGFISVLESNFIRGSGSGGITAPAGALVAHRHAVTETGDLVPVTVLAPPLEMLLARAEGMGYVASTPGDWSGAVPTNVNAAIDRIAAHVAGSLGPIT
jgi:hypothetical protein